MLQGSFYDITFDILWVLHLLQCNLNWIYYCSNGNIYKYIILMDLHIPNSPFIIRLWASEWIYGLLYADDIKQQTVF